MGSAPAPVILNILALVLCIAAALGMVPLWVSVLTLILANLVR